VRQTTAERWAESHRPPGVVEVDYVTCDWKTSGVRDPRVWRQHFSLHSGRPLCLVCVQEHEPRPDSPFCSEGCAASYAAASSQGAGRRQVYDRDRGVCAACGFDAHRLYRQIAALATGPERMQALQRTHYPTKGDRIGRLLRDPKEGDFWEADHILPVEEGGGESDLSNLQTLCVPCHADKTRRQAQSSKERKRQAAAKGTADLRSFFAGKA